MSSSLVFLILVSSVLADTTSLVLCFLVLTKPRLTSLANPYALRSPLFSLAPISLVLASLAQAIPISLAPISLALISLASISFASIYLSLVSLVLISPGLTNVYYLPLNS